MRHVAVVSAVIVSATATAALGVAVSAAATATAAQRVAVSAAAAAATAALGVAVSAAATAANVINVIRNLIVGPIAPIADVVAPVTFQILSRI